MIILIFIQTNFSMKVFIRNIPTSLDHPSQNLINRNQNKNEEIYENMKLMKCKSKFEMYKSQI